MDNKKEEKIIANKIYLKGFKAIDITLKNLFSDYSISYEQYIILRLISDSVNRTSELAEKVYETRSGVSRQLTILNRRGLVTFEDNPNDRRFTDVKITSAGYKVLKDAESKELDTYRYMLKKVGKNNLIKYFNQTL